MAQHVDAARGRVLFVLQLHGRDWVCALSHLDLPHTWFRYECSYRCVDAVQPRFEYCLFTLSEVRMESHGTSSERVGRCVCEQPSSEFANFAIVADKLWTRRRYCSPECDPASRAHRYANRRIWLRPSAARKVYRVQELAGQVRAVGGSRKRRGPVRLPGCSCAASVSEPSGMHRNIAAHATGTTHDLLYTHIDMYLNLHRYEIYRGSTQLSVLPIWVVDGTAVGRASLRARHGAARLHRRAKHRQQ